jgi:hypothetical protein
MEQQLLGDKLRQLTKEYTEAVEKFEAFKNQAPDFLKKRARTGKSEGVIVENISGKLPPESISLIEKWLKEQKIDFKIQKNLTNATHDDLHVSWKP